MSKRWYAVQHGDNFESDFGSTVKREAIKMARELHKEYPGEEIRLCLCREDDDFCEGEIIVYSGTRIYLPMDTEMMEMMVSDWMFEHQDEYESDPLLLDGKPYYSEDYAAWVQDAHDSTTTYVLVDYNGNIDIQYVGTM